MSAKNTLKKILDHPDKDEIISKLIIGIPPKDIHDWLKSKYTNVKESKFVFTEPIIKSFKDKYLDIYTIVRDDLSKTTTALVDGTEDQLELALKNNPTYKNIMIKTASKELDIKQIITNLCVAVESRLAQVFDEIQKNPEDINPKIDQILIEYMSTLGNTLEKYYKFTEKPVNQVVQHNVTLQIMDQHISIFYDVIREILSKMDLETSLYFMEIFNEKMAKLRSPSEKAFPNVDARLAEVKLLNETISKKIGK